MQLVDSAVLVSPEVLQEMLVRVSQMVCLQNWGRRCSLQGSVQSKWDRIEGNEAGHLTLFHSEL